jgi:hypothetical protein
MGEINSKLTFSDDAGVSFILEDFNHSEDDKGYIIDGLGERVLSIDGKMTKINNLEGFYLDNNVMCFIRDNQHSEITSLKKNPESFSIIWRNREN